MRDPNRIPDIIKALGRYWKQNPDLRLGQIIVNMAERDDPFYVEDDLIKVNLKRDF